jgi:hypothetical protein
MTVGIGEAAMGVWQSIKGLFAPGGPWPADAIKLDATSTQALSRSLKQLVLDERGWISFAEARALFSTADAQYAFGETDDAGNANLASFAAAGDRPYAFEFMPAEGRVYFARKAP